MLPAHMVERPRVAVILPVFNRAVMVRETLASVARQTAPPTELIVVDDGSTDAIEAAFDGWKTSFQPAFSAQLLRQENRGASSARNTGIAAAPHADCYAFLDSDDTWPDDFLARTTSALQRNPEAIAASVDQLFVNSETGFTRREEVRTLPSNPAHWMIKYGAGVGSATLFRADVIRAHGGFDPSIPTGHDAHLFLRVSLCGPWLHCPGAPAVYGLHTALVGAVCGHLRHRFPNYEEIWASIYEQFIAHANGRANLSKRFCKRQMAQRWLRAGLQWVALGRHDRARVCFGRSMRYRLRQLSMAHWTRSFLTHLMKGRPICDPTHSHEYQSS